jgi:ABC-type nickel/cobalt efflux system permease component RcnA
MRIYGLLASLVLVLAIPAEIDAHPMGNFSINHHSKIHVGEKTISIQYVLDFSEIPTIQMFPEKSKALDQVGNWVQTLSLMVDGLPSALRVDDVQVEEVPGAAALSTLRVTILLSSVWTGDGGLVSFSDGNFPERIGWKEIVISADAPLGFSEGNAFAVDRSNALRSYPQDPLAAAPNVVHASVRVENGAISDKTVSDQTPGIQTERGGNEVTQRLSEILRQEQLPPQLLLLAMVIAFSLGAFHALSPGHGKTVMAAYLVGNRGTARHAVLLGAVVTFTHTAGVFLFGAVTLFLSRYIVPERLYPWLGFLSGVTILSIGVRLFRQRLQGVHDHLHDLPEGITFRNLLLMGFSGGIVPCPSALVVLLSAVALGRIEIGLLLIVAFSLGLACVLVAIGILAVRASACLFRFDAHHAFLNYLPLLSAGLISLLGLGIALQSLAGTSLGTEVIQLEGQGLAVLALGLFLGLKHATDADHVVAVTTFLSQERSVFRSCWIGVFWGMGHTLSLAIAGLMVIVLKIGIPDWLGARLEFAVAVMLVALGARLLIRTLRGMPELHTHDQEHLSTEDRPAHHRWHFHAGSKEHTDWSWSHVGLKPLLVGMVHGAAGSAALMLLVLSTIRSPLEAFLYILIFGVGSVAGMLAISFLLALPLRWAKGRMVSGYRPIQLMAGLFSCLFGLYLGTEVWISLP